MKNKYFILHGWPVCPCVCFPVVKGTETGTATG